MLSRLLVCWFKQTLPYQRQQLEQKYKLSAHRNLGAKTGAMTKNLSLEVANAVQVAQFATGPKIPVQYSPDSLPGQQKQKAKAPKLVSRG